MKKSQNPKLKRPKIYLDFEYNNTKEKDVNLVCVSWRIDDGATQSLWLHKNTENKKAAAKAFEKFHNLNAVFVSYAVTAEARSFCALGLNPVAFDWIDLHLEYKMLLNHNNYLATGKHLFNDRGRISIRNVSEPKPKWQMTEEEKLKADMSKPHTSLLSATFKLLGVRLDGEHKDAMRKLIISAPDSFSKAERVAIMKYCESDIKYLPKLHKEILSHYPSLMPDENRKTLFREMLLRGEYSARTARMERLGYPVDMKKLRKFVAALPEVVKDLCEDINSQFPKNKPFVWKKSEGRYSMKLAVVQDWIIKQGLSKRWMKTATKRLSVSHDAFAAHFHFKHTYPRGDFGAQMLRFFKFNQSLNGFKPSGTKNKETFFDYVGSDDRCRPYMGHYGAQSSRSQPKATSFIPLKAAWMRSFIKPKKGKTIGVFDYSSEEFLLGALVSDDSEMIAAYKSGDVYLYFGKIAGAIPMSATKATHPFMRDKFKATTLGMSYDMTEIGLAPKLTQDTGIKHTESEAKELIDLFKTSFPSYNEWKQINIDEYRRSRFIKLPCGWYMFGDNNNFRSVNNVVVQGIAGSILRKAVALAQDTGLQVIYTLHDAVYIQFDDGDLAAMDTLKRCMIEAFVFYFKGQAKEHAGLIRLDGNIWGRSCLIGSVTTPKGVKLKSQRTYIDPRSISEYKQFKKYFS